MKTKLDEDLVRIIYIEKEDYHPEAISAAETELSVRQLNESHIQQLIDTLEDAKLIKNTKVNEPLTWKVRVWVFIFPFLFNFFLAFIYKADGYDKKTREVWKWTLYGVCFYCILILLMFITYSFS
ncbi:MAG: hypothetical protein LUF85_12900 [Bacteroides sp.]|nr:hypothetical protein [Bacteroides sp.]